MIRPTWKNGWLQALLAFGVLVVLAPILATKEKPQSKDAAVKCVPIAGRLEPVMDYEVYTNQDCSSKAAFIVKQWIGLDEVLIHFPETGKDGTIPRHSLEDWYYIKIPQ